MDNPSKEQIKGRAKHLRQVLLDKYKLDISHGHALEVLAKVFGFKDWNTASALVEAAPKGIPPTNEVVATAKKEIPPAARFKTVGEAIDFFSQFDRSTKLVINEYKKTDAQSIHEYDFGIPTFVCSLSYDGEIQREGELLLELDQENFTVYQLTDFGKSRNQSWDHTNGGRVQRKNKWFNMTEGFWNPESLKKHFPIK